MIPNFVWASKIVGPCAFQWFFPWPQQFCLIQAQVGSQPKVPFYRSQLVPFSEQLPLLPCSAPQTIAALTFLNSVFLLNTARSLGSVQVPHCYAMAQKLPLGNKLEQPQGSRHLFSLPLGITVLHCLQCLKTVFSFILLLFQFSKWGE